MTVCLYEGYKPHPWHTICQLSGTTQSIIKCTLTYWLIKGIPDFPMRWAIAWCINGMSETRKILFNIQSKRTLFIIEILNWKMTNIHKYAIFKQKIWSFPVLLLIHLSKWSNLNEQESLISGLRQKHAQGARVILHTPSSFETYTPAKPNLSHGFLLYHP